MNRREVLISGAAAAVLPSRAIAAGADITLNGALPFLDVELPGGNRARFLLDTGAEVTVVDRMTFESAGLEISRGLRLGIGGQYRSVNPVFRDLAPVSTALKQTVAGLLGSDFLSAFRIAIDFSAKRLALDPGGLAKPLNAQPMRFSRMPFVQAEVRHGRSTLHGEFGLDTGLDTGVKIKDSMTTPMMRLATSDASIVTMEGAKAVQKGTVDALRVGGLDVVTLNAIVSADPAPSGAGQTYAGTIGAHAFQNRILTLDYPGGWWSLSPVIL